MLKIEELVHAFVSKRCDFEKQIVLTNYFHADWEADIFVIDESGFSHEIEIKFSKSDFKNDFKKKYTNQFTGEKYLKHDKICCGDYICNRFSFLLPMGLIKHSDIPEHCGIIEFYHDVDDFRTTFETIREPRKIHEDVYWKLNDKDLFLRKMALNLMQKKFQVKAKTEELIFRNPFELKQNSKILR